MNIDLQSQGLILKSSNHSPMPLFRLYFQKGCSRIKFYLLLIFPQISLILYPQLAQARFDPHLIRGTHALVEESHSYLSPIYGLILLRSTLIENYRFFGNYGPKKEGLSCFDRTTLGHELREIDDCPQDYFSEFLQKFLTSPDFGNIDPNPLKGDIVNRLTPEALGALALWMDRVSQVRLLQIEQEEILSADLVNTLIDVLNPRLKWVAEFQELNIKRKRLETQMKKLQISSELLLENPQYQKIKLNHEQLTEQASQIKKIMDESSEDKSSVHAIDLKPLANLTVRALRESVLKSQIYSKKLLIHALYAFFFTTHESKQELLELLRGLSPVLTPIGNSIISGSHPQDLELRNQFLSMRYLREDFHRAHSGLTRFLAPFQDESLSEGPAQRRFHPSILDQRGGKEEDLFTDQIHAEELQAFRISVDQFYQLEIPELVTFASSSHSSLPTGQRYSDCGETAIRNFFNIYLYNPITRQFDPEKLNRLEGSLHHGRRIHINRRLIEFYKRHPDPARAFSQAVRDDWSENVVSSLPLVEYSQPEESREKVTEISNGLENLTRVFDQLLFGDSSPIYEREATVEELRASALDTLSVFSPRIKSCMFEYDPDNRIRLDVEKNESSGFNERLSCSLNNGSRFHMHISADHFFIRIPSSQRVLRDSLSTQFYALELTSGASSSHSSSLFHTSCSEHALTRDQAKELALNLPLVTEEGLRQFLDLVIQHQLSELYPMLKKGILRFPRSPERTLRMNQRLIELLASSVGTSEQQSFF